MKSALKSLAVGTTFVGSIALFCYTVSKLGLTEAFCKFTVGIMILIAIGMLGWLIRTLWNELTEEFWGYFKHL